MTGEYTCTRCTHVEKIPTYQSLVLIYFKIGNHRQRWDFCEDCWKGARMLMTEFASHPKYSEKPVGKVIDGIEPDKELRLGKQGLDILVRFLQPVKKPSEETDQA